MARMITVTVKNGGGATEVVNVDHIRKASPQGTGSRLALDDTGSNYLDVTESPAAVESLANA